MESTKGPPQEFSVVGNSRSFRQIIQPRAESEVNVANETRHTGELFSNEETIFNVDFIIYEVGAGVTIPFGLRIFVTLSLQRLKNPITRTA